MDKEFQAHPKLRVMATLFILFLLAAMLWFFGLS